MCKENDPCYGCEKRRVISGYNCHSDCPEYKAYHERNAERSEMIRKKKAEEHDYVDMKLRAVNKTLGKKHMPGYWKG